jgi:competence protein ComEA
MVGRLDRVTKQPAPSLILGWLEAALLLGAITVVAQERTAEDPLPKGPGKDAVETICGTCHEVGTAIGTRRTRSEWRQVIDAMINRGALGSDEDFKAVLDYLSKYFGLVRINKATAKELEEVLEISSSDAETIVRYRSEHGEFATLDDVKKVPGIDGAAIEERKKRVAFK